MQLRSLGIILVMLIVALLMQQGYFSSGVDLAQPQTLFINTSRAAGITQNHEAIEKDVGQAVFGN